jgi:hypothetical protein
MTKRGKRCKATAIGREALEQLELLDHEHAGEWCSFHLVGAKRLSDKAHAAKRQARKLAAETAAEPEPVTSWDKTKPGEVVATVDVYRDHDEPEPEPASVYTRSIYNTSVGANFGLLTPEQRLIVLRARIATGVSHPRLEMCFDTRTK